MKIYEILKEDGRIVKGVNTTVDVSTDEIKTQAAKFGNTVDKDGRPPTLSSKVKGKSTNVLFNLGLAEGIILKLERDKHMDVLHIMDTNEKHRVEVRGKKGYESGNYDAQDKLHQVLDSVGKAANISELINGETVSINPNHPQGTRAIRTAQDVLQTEEAPATAPLPELRPKNFDQIVARYKNKKPSALAELLKEFAPNILILIASAIGLIHITWLQKFFVQQGIKFSQKQMQTAMAQAESIEENFADGKKKGKSRPGRVKRSGASCNGSVTDLRKRAKNASGEKAKMYHWCANMKSGRKKK
jgi:hypothetical protein